MTATSSGSSLLLPWDLILRSLPHNWMAPMEPQRSPFLTIPSVTFGGGDDHDITTVATPAVEFYMPSIIFWLELLAILLFMIGIAVLVSCVVYHCCVIPERQFTMTSYLVGYGLVVPFWLILPATLSYQLGVQNKVFNFMITTCVPAISCFRTTAAIHGYSPHHTVAKMSDFTFYYAAPVLSKYDSKTKQYTRSKRLVGYCRFYQLVCWSGCIFSLYAAFPTIFPSISKPSSEEPYEWYDVRLLLDRHTLWNNLLLAALFQLYLTTFAYGLMLLQSDITGYETVETMNNPVFGSTSPSDFWSRRWNRIIHDCLKRGVFLPVQRATGSKTTAVLSAFFASSLFHEWLQITCFPKWNQQPTIDGTCRLVGYREEVFSETHCYTPKYGAAMAFFMWQSVLIAMEFALTPHLKKHGVLQQIPPIVKQVLTILAGGCVCHWFAEPYIHSTFFLDGQAALFSFKVVWPDATTSVEQ